MLNFPQFKRRKTASLSAVIVFSQLLAGCTGMALSNKEPASLVQGEWSLKQERKQAQQLQSQLPSRFNLRLIIGGFFSGETGLHRSNLTARATQAMAQRLKLQRIDSAVVGEDFRLLLRPMLASVDAG